MIHPSIIRILLTYIRSVKYVGQEELDEKLYVVSSELGIEPPPLNDVIDAINGGIGSSGFKVEKSLNEITNELTYSFVNNDRDLPINKELTTFKMSEIEVVQKVVDEIFTSDYHINYEELVNRLIIDHKINRSSSDLRIFLNKLISLGYLELSAGYLVASIRLLLELKHYLGDKYDMLSCKNCDTYVTRGVRHDDACFHYKCWDIWKRTNGVAEDEHLSFIGLKV